MKRTKTFTFSFLLLCLLLIFSSCAPASDPYDDNFFTETAEAEPNNTEPATTSENEYSKKLADLPSEDFGEKKFRIATDNTELVFSSNAESLVGKEYYLRNAAVEEKYHVKLSLTDESGLPTISDRIRTEALAGSDYCDLILLESTQFQTLASADALINVRSVPYLNTDASYYFARSLEATTQGNFSYGISGDFTYKPDEVFAVFFNRDLLALTALPDLYSLVRENQWDMENFLLYAEEVFTLGRQNGTKISGITSARGEEDLVNIFWAATGFDFMQNEYGYRPELVYDHEYTHKYITTIRNIFFRSTSYSSGAQSAVSSFGNGESLFLIAPLSAASKLTGHGIDWGIVPIPKLDINQISYYSYVENSFTLAGFAKGTADLDLSGMVTSALFCASEGLNQTLKIQSFLNLHLNSAQDAEMMERIIESPYYDPVEFFGQIDASYTASTQTLLYRVISSGGDFNTLYKQYQKMLDKYLDTIF